MTETPDSMFRLVGNSHWLPIIIPLFIVVIFCFSFELLNNPVDNARLGADTNHHVVTSSSPQTQLPSLQFSTRAPLTLSPTTSAGSSGGATPYTVSPQPAAASSSGGNAAGPGSAAGNQGASGQSSDHTTTAANSRSDGLINQLKSLLPL